MTSRRPPKDKKTRNQGHGEDIERYMKPAGAREAIELADDDEPEIQEMSPDPFAFHDEEVQTHFKPKGLRSGRQRRLSNEDSALLQGYSEGGMTEEEQIERALQESKLEMEREQERQAMCGSVHNNMVKLDFTSTREQTKPPTEKEEPMEVSQPSRLVDDRGGAESPDMFGTPEDDDDNEEKFVDAQESPDDELLDSPSMVTGVFTSRQTMADSAHDGCKSETVTSHLRKSMSSSFMEIKKPQDFMERYSTKAARGGERDKLKLRKPKETPVKTSTSTKTSASATTPTSTKTSASATTSTSTKAPASATSSGPSISYYNSLKRKPLHTDPKAESKHPEEDDDVTDDERPPSPVINTEQRKKQKTMDDSTASFTVEDKLNSRSGSESGHMVIDLDDDRGSDENQQHGKESTLNESATKGKKSVNVRLIRKYKKAAMPITSIKDAIRARMFRAPPGFNQEDYTQAIVQFLDLSSKRIQEAQARCKNYIKWGNPVVAGPRQGDTLDARVETRRRGAANRESYMAKRIVSPAEGSSTEHRKRSLRSGQQLDTSTKEPLSSTNPWANVGYLDSNLGYVDSDSDDELLQPVFGKKKKAKAKLKMDSDKKGKENLRKSDNGITEKQEEESADPDFTLFEHLTSMADSTDVAQKEKKVEETDALGKANNKDRKLLKSSSKKKLILSDIQNAKEKNKSMPGKKSEASQHKSSHGEDQKKGNVNSQDKPRKETPNKASRGSQRIKEETHSSVEVLASECEVIDSSDHIGRGRGRPRKRKHRTIDDDFSDEDQEDVKESSASKNEKGESPMPDLVPGASLASAAEQEVSSETTDVLFVDPPKRTLSEAAVRAAQAAERRHGMTGSSMTSDSQENTVCSSIGEDIAIDIDPVPPEQRPDSQLSGVNCPLCFHNFPASTIENHAANCNGPAEDSSAASSSVRTRQEPRPNTAKSSVSPNVTSSLKDSHSRILRDFRVVVQRSPEADQRLKQQRKRRTPRPDTTRNIFYGESQESGTESETRRQQDDLTRDEAMDQSRDVTVTRDLEFSQSQPRSSPVNVPDDDSPAHSWLSDSSQERKKFKITYGGRSKKTDRTKGAFTSDYIPLEPNQSQDDDDSDDGVLSGPSYETRTTGKPAKLPKRSAQQFFDSSSDSDPDVKLLANYGITISPKKRNQSESNTSNNSRSINDALRSNQSGKSKGDNNRRPKRTREDGVDDVDYENELALAQLSGHMSKGEAQRARKARATKVRRVRASDSSQESDALEMCYCCGQRIPAEEYARHSDGCLPTRGASTDTPGKEPGDKATRKSSGSHKRSEGRRAEHTNTSVPGPSDAHYITMDPSAISDSPVKTFSLIGEHSDSTVDFGNQFAFFHEKKGSRGGRGRGSKGGDVRGFRKRGRWRRRRGRGR